MRREVITQTLHRHRPRTASDHLPASVSVVAAVVVVEMVRLAIACPVVAVLIYPNIRQLVCGLSRTILLTDVVAAAEIVAGVTGSSTFISLAAGFAPSMSTSADC